MHKPEIAALFRNFGKFVDADDVAEWNESLEKYQPSVVKSVLREMLSRESERCPTLGAVLSAVRKKQPPEQGQYEHKLYPTGWTGYVEVERAWSAGARSLNITGYVPCRVDGRWLIIARLKKDAVSTTETYCVLDEVLRRATPVVVVSPSQLAAVDEDAIEKRGERVREWARKMLDAGWPSTKILERLAGKLAGEAVDAEA